MALPSGERPWSFPPDLQVVPPSQEEIPSFISQARNRLSRISVRSLLTSPLRKSVLEIGAQGIVASAILSGSLAFVYKSAQVDGIPQPPTPEAKTSKLNALPPMTLEPLPVASPVVSASITPEIIKEIASNCVQPTESVYTVFNRADGQIFTVFCHNSAEADARNLLNSRIESALPVGINPDQVRVQSMNNTGMGGESSLTNFRARK
jgi:hypothetical protein